MSRTARRGRTVAVTSVGIEDAEARTVAMATGRALILPDRPWGTAERDDAR